MQLYSPFVVFNKTGLPFSVKATKSARSGWQEAAGDTRLCERLIRDLGMVLSD